MAGKTIQTTAVISAQDKTGEAFNSVIRRLAKMESAAKSASGGLRTIERAQAATHRGEAAHERERMKVQREMGHHGAVRYATQAAVSAVAAHSIVEKITESLKGGAELQHSLTGLKNSGRTMEEISEIMNRAGQVMKSVPTSSLKENLDTILETTGAFGNLHHALENLEFVQKITSVLKSAGNGEATSKSVAYDFAKFAEIRGSAGDTKRLQSESNEMTRGMVFTGGKFNPHEAFAFAQQTSSLLGKYSIHFLSRILPSLATEAGGERTGTRANAFANVILGKARDQKQTAEWVRLGLLDPKLVIKNKTGAQGWKPGAVKNTNLWLSDPDKAVEQILLPAMKAHGINTDDSFEVTKELNQLYRNGESNRFATALTDTLQRSRLHKDDENIGKAGDVHEIYKRNLSEDPTVAVGALKESMESLLSVVSQPIMATAAKGLSGLAIGIGTLADSLKDHPLIAAGGGAVVAGTALAGAGKMAASAANGFGLAGSATALDASAIALTEAAGVLGAKGAIASGEAAADKILAGGAGAAEAGSLAKTGGRAAGILGLGTLASVGVVAGAGAAAGGALIYGSLAWKQAHPEEFHAHAQHAYGMDGPKAEPEKIFVSHPRRGSSGDWVDNPKFRSPASQFTPIASQFAPVGGFNPANPFGKGAAAPPQKVDVTIDPPAPIKMTFEVVPSSVLLQIVEQSKTAALQLKAHADTGPGGLGETHTGQH